MATLAFPDIIPQSAQWSIVSNTQAFDSPLDGTTQTSALPGAKWAATLTYNNMQQDNLRTFSAFLAQLRGRSGRFYLYDHSLPTPRGVATGTPLVNGASQTGSTLITDGWTPSTTGIMKAGDYVGFNDELRILTADADSDVGGNATLSLDSPMRSSPANNAVITVIKPKAIMMLTQDESGWGTTPPLLSSFSIPCIEAFS